MRSGNNFINPLSVRWFLFSLSIDKCKIVSWSDSQYSSYSRMTFLRGLDYDPINPLLTHPPLDKMAAILADNIFKCIFLIENDSIPLQISLKFVPRSPINNKPALVQVMAWHRSAAKPLSEPMLTQFSDAKIQHMGEMNYIVPVLPVHWWACLLRPKYVAVYSIKYAHGFVLLYFVVVRFFISKVFIWSIHRYSSGLLH